MMRRRLRPTLGPAPVPVMAAATDGDAPSTGFGWGTVIALGALLGYAGFHAGMRTAMDGGGCRCASGPKRVTSDRFMGTRVPEATDRQIHAAYEGRH